MTWHAFLKEIQAAQQGLEDKADIDDAITEILVSTDEERRQELYTFVLTRLHEDAVYIPLTYECNKAIYRSDLQGFHLRRLSMRFRSLISILERRNKGKINETIYLKRILSAIPLLIIISFVCFVFINLIPSDPAEVALRIRQVPIITKKRWHR